LLLNYVIQSLDLKNKLEEDLFYECILKNQKVILIARQYDIPYPTVYLKYKKIKEKVEKLLTNLPV
ncbi:MAG: hypothetical protein K2O22_05745, partial [Anaeroplasmataceae bacterium]|nr:hypothetical protein [Anaeroplasmataceae bacterium]